MPAMAGDVEVQGEDPLLVEKVQGEVTPGAPGANERLASWPDTIAALPFTCKRSSPCEKLMTPPCEH
jgi:hypothetical protein